MLALVVLEDPWDISDTLELIIVNEMNESVAKRFIEWVNNGNEPMKFDTNPRAKGNTQEEDPFTEAWKGLGPLIKVKHKGGENYEIKLAVTGGQKALEAAQAAQMALEGSVAAKLAGFLYRTGNPKS